MVTSGAVDIAAAVRASKLDPVRPTEDALSRIKASDGAVGAFRSVRAAEALAEAKALRDRPDLRELPLAGVPVAVKDVVSVEGASVEWGSRATDHAPASADHEVVARLRAAGAVIVGLTRVPELCIWPMTDTPEGIARNPRQPSYVAGGSSGGSAAAVAAGLVPLAHGTDGLGSIRLPSAMCGLVGIKPGRGVVAESSDPQWFGMSAHGAIATTAADAALLLGVLAERPGLRTPRDPGRLRVAVSTQVPLTHAPVPGPMREAVRRAGARLGAAGHRVVAATPAYGAAALGLLTRWFAGPAEQADDLGVDSALLQRRTRTHVRIGNAVRRAGLVREDSAREWTRRAEAFFADHDVLVTPTLAARPPKARRWHERSCLANAAPSIRLAGFAGLWNLAGFPAMSVPAGQFADGLPIGVQLVAAPGGEATLLGLAAQLEETNRLQ
ncbi:amidase [Prauserella sp. PE36]|uniref:amidase family protein n=1 Tax=Prauserella sp. PE36 TaxID=1504709 RepID=UPI000D96604F|nr:amidase family protein [Prauserella sp. PE36]PXY26545.1 amidase [Prauserella coralliicola]RBM10616.1 amidase [Prauserella sp. PE36]